MIWPGVAPGVIYQTPRAERKDARVPFGPAWQALLLDGFVVRCPVLCRVTDLTTARLASAQASAASGSRADLCCRAR